MLGEAVMEGYNIIKKFDTKRNKVYLAERLNRRYIVKQYASGASLDSEFKVLRALEGKANVPRAIHRSDNEIVMDYIPGDSLAIRYAKGSLLEMPTLAVQFAKFLKSFMAALPGYSINDINYRNYIINKGVCFGLDFEFIVEGNITRTAAESVAFGLLVDNVSVEKKKLFLKTFLKEMGVKIADIREQLVKEINKHARNMGVKVNAEDAIKLLE